MVGHQWTKRNTEDGELVTQQAGGHGSRPVGQVELAVLVEGGQGWHAAHQQAAASLHLLQTLST